MFLNCSSFIQYWVLLELNIIFFIFIIVSSNSYGENIRFFTKNFYYFLIQTLGSFIFLFSILISSIEFFFTDMFVTLSIILKIGLYPTHFWVYEISNYLSCLRFNFLVTFQKLPSFIIFFNLNLNFVLFYLFLNIISGSIIIFFSTKLKNLVISSSLYNMVWIFLIFLLRPLLFFLFFFNFFYFNLILTKEKFIAQLNFTLNRWRTIIFLSMTMLIGLPPLRIFFFKIYVLEILISIANIAIFSIIFVFTLFSVFGYFKFFFIRVIESSYIYINFKFKINSILIIIIILMSLMII